MRLLKSYFTFLLVILFIPFTSCKKDSDRLVAVRIFADNVLEKGLDRWSGQDTPLLSDGINILTEEPVEWIFNGEHFIIHNLASQQNLFRTFVALSNLTGDNKYREAARDAIGYHFDNLRSDCGLLRWGGHQIIDLRTLKPVGHFDANCHEFKNNLPFYELMWEVDSKSTIEFLRAFWNAHILDWKKLDMNRHGRYGLDMGDLWDNEFIHPEPFFEARGLTFLNAGTDLIYAGGMLYILNSETGALKWAELLAEQYVRARHPDTGLGAFQYSKLQSGDRAEVQFGIEFPGVAREGWVLFPRGGDTRQIYTVPNLIQFELSERLGEKGSNLLEWSVDGLKAYAKHAYNPANNTFKPMWADGTDLTNYVFPRTGYYGPEGIVLTHYDANEELLFSYSRAYRLSKDEFLWDVVRSMFKGLELGDPGVKPGNRSRLNLDTGNSDPSALFALLELHRAVDDPAYLELAEVIGNNILERSFHGGFFLPSEKHINANFNNIEPLALLSLEAALQGRHDLVPVYSGGRGFIHGRFDGIGRTYASSAIWSKTR